VKGAAVDVRRWYGSRKAGEGQNDHGQAMVEFALTVPIIIILFISVVLFSFMLYSFVTMSHSAREGARHIVGAPYATDAEVENYMKTKLGLLDSDLAVIDIEPDEADRVPGANITVKVSYPFQLVDVYVPYIIAPGGLTMFPPVWVNAVSTMNMD
jgi:Flp pilus assembly protein TadG